MAAPANRLFYSLPTAAAHQSESAGSNSEKLLTYVRDNIIGNDKVFSGPFGLRKVTYLDYIASGRSLGFIEDYIRKEVLPEYGNTHTTTSITSLQTTLFRHEARDIIRNSVKASEHDSVIFVGSGCTAAIHKLIHALDFQRPPVVFVGPFEHHSNLLPWMEIGSEVIRIGLTSEGSVDLQQLETELKQWQGKGRQLLGCFSAASNITGVLTDVNAVTVLLHQQGALAFWDYATAAPYVDIDMNPVISGVDQPFVYKDAVFLSPHKFVGGVSTPGVLIAKKKLFRNSVPDGCGGGSVFFVRREGHRYLQEPELKEEGGTPAIVESVRAGLVFQLKDAISSSTIMQHEHQLTRQALAAWGSVKELVLLGPPDLPSLPVFSFLVHHPPSNRFLHHNFVAALLNDIFGIQARGGCACAGPYAMDVLGLNEETAFSFENILAEDSRLDRTHLRRYREYSHREILRPGFVRLTLPYFLDTECVEFVLAAVAMVAREGWKMLPQYMFNPETGEWRQRNFQVFKDRKWLSHVSYQSGEMQYRVPPPVVKGPLPADFQECLKMARDLFQQASKKSPGLPDQSLMFDAEAEKMRWFLLPSEAEACLHGNGCSPLAPENLPFCPPSLWCQLAGNLEATNRTNHSVETRLVSRSREATPNSLHSTAISPQQEAKLCREVEDSGEAQTPCVKDDDSVEKKPGRSDDPVREQAQANGEKCNDLENQRQTVLWSPAGLAQGDLMLPGKNSLKTLGSRNCTESGVNLQGENSAKTSHFDVLNDLPSSDLHSFPEGMAGALERGYCDASQTSLGVNCDLTENVLPLHNEELTNSTASTDAASVRGVHTPDRNTAEISGFRNTETDSNHSDSAKSSENNDAKEYINSTESETVKAVVGKSTLDNSATSSLEGKPGGASTKPRKKKKRKVKVEACPLQCPPSVPEPAGSKAVTNYPQWRWFSPPKCIFKPTVQAVEEYSMLRDGDRVLVCLSGGKDSLSLLHTMRQLQFYCRGKGVNFDLGAVTVDPQTPAYDPQPLKGYLASLGVPYFYESQCILETATSLPYECASICSFCSRMKRGRIYAAARREDYNVLALGQHLDDLAESFLMSFFHNGTMRTMKAHYTVENNDLRVIRPFVYVREKDLRNFAEKNKLPVIAENCPACFEAPKERHRIKQLLASQELLFPRVYSSMMAALKPLLAINRTHVNIRALMAETGAAGGDMED